MSLSPDQLSSVFSALADPTRRAILVRLSQSECSVQELAAPFKISQPAISKHLKVLENAGLVGRGREAQWRPCRIQAAPLKEVVDWLERYREFWDLGRDQFDDDLQKLQSLRKSAGSGRNRESREKSRGSRK